LFLGLAALLRAICGHGPVSYKMSDFKGGHHSTDYRARRPRIPQGQSARRQMLDMKRQKYFRFDLDDMLEAFKIGENKTTVLAAILNKASSRSIDEAYDYIDRISEGGTVNEEQAYKLKTLLQRYSKWR
jgi:hypothetical protein